MKHSKIKVLDEHSWIRARANVYLGSTERVKQEFYFANEGKFKEVEYIPALLKIYEEILENSVDEYIRTKGEYANKIEVIVEKDGLVQITDNGRGLEIAKHDQFTDLYIPEVIFTKLRSGSNFEGTREGIGVNGLGAVLTVLFSKTFMIYTYSHGKGYTQSYENMLQDIYPPKIKTVSGDKHGTNIMFRPDFEFFKTKNWNLDLLRKRVEDLAFSFPEIKFTFNDEKIDSKKYKDIVKNYTDDYVIEEGEKAKVILAGHESGEFLFSATVNGANTFHGGTPVDYVISEIVNELKPKLEKKCKVALRANDIKNHLTLFIQLNLDNPIFSSQTKEKVQNTVEEVKPLFADILTDRFYKKILSNETIINKITEEAKVKQQLKELQDVKAKQKQIVKKKVAKLIDANSIDREECILFLTEGDSVSFSGAVVRNPKVHAFLPLRGKVLNVYDLTPSKVLQNEEIQDMLNAIGLKVGERALSLRYGKITLLADEDPDGHAIKALLINFFYKYWPELFVQKKICFIKSPLYIAEKGNDKIYIYDKAQYDNLEKQGKLKGYKISYFKGLGGLEQEDYDYFLNKNPQFITVNVDDISEDKLKVVFSTDGITERKAWMLA